MHHFDILRQSVGRYDRFVLLLPDAIDDQFMCKDSYRKVRRVGLFEATSYMRDLVEFAQGFDSRAASQSNLIDGLLGRSRLNGMRDHHTHASVHTRRSRLRTRPPIVR